MLKLAALALLALLAACGGSAPPNDAGAGGAGVGGGGTGGMSGTGAVGGGGTGAGGTGGGTCFNPGTDPNRNMVTASGVCERLAQIQCAAEACCCPSGNPRKYPSVDACIATQSQICTDLGTEIVAVDSRTGFNATALTAAFGEFERLGSLCSVDVASWGTSQSGFASVLTGTRDLGATCWTPVSLPVEDNPAAAAASCGTVNACLGDSLVTSTAWTCQPRRAAGGRCLADPSCQDGLFCENPPAPDASPPRLTLGTCTARFADGASCSFPSQCSSLFCVDGRCVPPSIEAAYCIQP